MKIDNCRVCNSARIKKIIDLGMHPLADTFLPEDKAFEPEVYYPLRLGLCENCGHVFTLFSIPPEERYQKTEYSYDSSNSMVSIEHFKLFASTLVSYSKPSPGAMICDVGSNIGTLLSQFKALGYENVIGIEPSVNIARIAMRNKIMTINSFFSEPVAIELSRKGGVDLLVSSNVVNHMDDLKAMLSNVSICLKSNGLFVFEVPYLLDLVNATAFDTIYHEHVNYFGLRSIDNLLRGSDFSVIKVERLDYMCGSIRVYVKRGHFSRREVDQHISNEEDFGLYDLETYESFMERLRLMRLKLLSRIFEIRSQGGLIVGIGAATKGNTLLNYCKLDSDSVLYVSDTSPLKVGKYTPGSKIKIISDDDLTGRFTHGLILPWNIASFLKEKLSHLPLEFISPQIPKVHPKI